MVANRAIVWFIAFTFLWVGVVGAGSQTQARAEMRRVRSAANYWVYATRVAAERAAQSAGSFRFVPLPN